MDKARLEEIEGVVDACRTITRSIASMKEFLGSNMVTIGIESDSFHGDRSLSYSIRLPVKDLLKDALEAELTSLQSQLAALEV